jgi:hypothetical protein
MLPNISSVHRLQHVMPDSVCSFGPLLAVVLASIRVSPAVCAPTAKSSDKSRRIGRKSGVGSTELPADTPGRRPEIGVFGLFLQIDVPVRRISYSLSTFGSNKHYSSANLIQFNKISK